jgi:hypothetical protein
MIGNAAPDTSKPQITRRSRLYLKAIIIPRAVEITIPIAVNRKNHISAVDRFFGGGWPPGSLSGRRGGAASLEGVAGLGFGGSSNL